MSEREFEDDWRAWHEGRERGVSAPHGVAALVGTHWLSPDPQAVPGLDGEWSLDGAAIVGPDFTLDEGGEALLHGLLLRHHRRDDDVALRVFDPDAPSRASVAGIDAYAPDPAWVLKGRFRPADGGERIDVTDIDGYVGNDALAGVVEVEVAGQKLELLATGPLTRLHVVFRDATSGGESYRFRFLFLRAEAGAGEIVVDFNRAILPPCAFADFYLCPLPAAQNVIASPVRAGEKAVLRT